MGAPRGPRGPGRAWPGRPAGRAGPADPWPHFGLGTKPWPETRTGILDPYPNKRRKKKVPETAMGGSWRDPRRNSVSGAGLGFEIDCRASPLRPKRLPGGGSGVPGSQCRPKPRGSGFERTFPSTWAWALGPWALGPWAPLGPLGPGGRRQAADLAHIPEFMANPGPKAQSFKITRSHLLFGKLLGGLRATLGTYSQQSVT